MGVHPMRSSIPPLAALLAGTLLAAPVAAQEDYACTWQASGDALTSRASPPDSARATIGGGFAKVCYGAPSARGRTMLGGEHVPFGRLWRLGANEATRLYVSFPASIGDVSVDPGAYSLYAVPGAERWRFFVNRDTRHWGNQITEEVREEEVGSLTVEPERLAEHVERMRLRFEGTGGNAAALVLEWENTRVRIPIRNAGG